MLYKIKNKPTWYKVWAILTLIGALYYLVKVFVSDFEPTPLDRFIHLFVLGSILLDFILFPKDRSEPPST